MGPNARKKLKLDTDKAVPLTHANVDKLLRPPTRPAQGRREPQERWIIKVESPRREFFWTPEGWSRGSGSAYWGHRRDGRPGVTPYKANAIKYDSENTALYEAYRNKEAGFIVAFEVKQLPPKSRLKGSSGTGGRA